MRNLVSDAQISLDSFLTGPGGELIDFDEGKENLEFVCRLTKDADAMLMGRVSYELLKSYCPSAKDIPDASDGTIILREIIPEKMTAIKKSSSLLNTVASTS